jgi:hypothetical protein
MNIPRKFHYVISNPPYGGDKINKSGEQLKRDKLIEHIKSLDQSLKTDIINEQLKDLIKQNNDYKKEQIKQTVNVNNCSQRIKKFAKDNNLMKCSNDKEACSLILLMDLVEEKGTCCGVLKEGVFFNKTYKDILKCLFENFNEINENLDNFMKLKQNEIELIIKKNKQSIIKKSLETNPV